MLELSDKDSYNKVCQGAFTNTVEASEK
jgi:hypothetical protein